MQIVNTWSYTGPEFFQDRLFEEVGKKLAGMIIHAYKERMTPLIIRVASNGRCIKVTHDHKYKLSDSERLNLSSLIKKLKSFPTIIKEVILCKKDAGISKQEALAAQEKKSPDFLKEIKAIKAKDRMKHQPSTQPDNGLCINFGKGAIVDGKVVPNTPEPIYTPGAWRNW